MNGIRYLSIGRKLNHAEYSTLSEEFSALLVVALEDNRR